MRLSEKLLLDIKGDSLARYRAVARLSGRPPGCSHEQHMQRASANVRRWLDLFGAGPARAK
eukprot:11165669-Lingulodinium_polyedra.AAC.1